MIGRFGAVVAALLIAPALFAHDGITHLSETEAQKHKERSETPLPPPSGLPFPVKFGGPFELTDHRGNTRTQADPEGRMQLLFFGYASCEAICSVALPMMAEATRRLEAAGVDIAPVMVTVDPVRDTVEALGPALAKHHPEFIGLTGSESALQGVYDSFSVARRVVFVDPDLGPVYAHGSHIFLLNGAGEFLTLLPPILTQERVAEIVSAYVTKP